MSTPILADQVIDVRWFRPTCGRFLAESAVRSWDEIDPGSYYGVRGVIVGTCRKCGEVEDPQCRPTRFRCWGGKRRTPPRSTVTSLRH